MFTVMIIMIVLSRPCLSPRLIQSDETSFIPEDGENNNNAALMN